MTHEELVQRAARWLRNTQRCSVVITEIVTGVETPDAVGFRARESILVECKTSLSDFYSDHQKDFRRNCEKGMGEYRYYMCEKGVIDPERHTFPPNWGLLYVCGRIVRIVKISESFHRDERMIHSVKRERNLLVAVLRRAYDGDPYLDGKISVEAITESGAEFQRRVESLSTHTANCA